MTTSRIPAARRVPGARAVPGVDDARTMFANHGTGSAGAGVTHDGTREGASTSTSARPSTRPSEIQVLTHALRGEVIPHAEVDRPWVQEVLPRMGVRARVAGNDEAAEMAALVLGLLAITPAASLDKSR